jgi:hypothetical protein
MIIGHRLFDAGRFVLPIFKVRRREAGNLAPSGLRAQNKQMRHGRCFCGAPSPRRASCDRALPSTEASVIQQAGIEPIVDRLADLDFFEIGMLGI